MFGTGGRSYRRHTTHNGGRKRQLYREIAFDLINAYDYEVQDLYDGADNAEGDSVEEGQYNTALSAIVENLMEE